MSGDVPQLGVIARIIALSVRHRFLTVLAAAAPSF